STRREGRTPTQDDSPVGVRKCHQSTFNIGLLLFALRDVEGSVSPGVIRRFLGCPRPRKSGAPDQTDASTDFEPGSAAASSLRELISSFWNTLRRWYSTVRGLR